MLAEGKPSSQSEIELTELTELAELTELTERERENQAEKQDKIHQKDSCCLDKLQENDA